VTGVQTCALPICDVYLNNKSNEEFSMLEMLYEQIVEDDLDEAHILLDNVFKGQGNQINAVISMYRNMNPANEILEELHEWAIKHNKLDVLNKIEGLSKKNLYI